MKSTTTNTMSWTGAYLFGDNNYIEIFAPSSSEHKTGNSAISLGSDYVGELQKTQNYLNQFYTTQIELRERKAGDSLIPWFQALYIVDSSFSSKSDIDFWIMEYKKEYYLYNHWVINGDSVTRRDYLAQHEAKRKNKYLKRFTGINFWATEKEISFYGPLLTKCGFTRVHRKKFISSEGFIINFSIKNSRSKYSIKSIQFISSKPSFQQTTISDNIKIVLVGQKGEIRFN